MKVILPLAGYATRLYPLTENLPKALLKINGTPILEHVLEKVLNVPEVDEIFIVSNDKFYSQFIGWLDEFKSKTDLKIKIHVLNDNTKSNEDRLGAVGDINFAVKEGGIDSDVLMLAGDNVFGFDLNCLKNLAKEKNSSVLAGFDLKDPKKLAKKFGVVLIDDNYKVTGFEEKPQHPKSSLAATMIYYLKKEDIKLLAGFYDQSFPDNWGEFAKYLAESKELYCLVFEETWFDIGNKEQYEEVNKLAEEGKLNI
ncbi:nucleotidyltransferase family protein [Candidatus Woesearchaeota archaeon]|jgi:glucose-1-phosphate thymidylyltransferase|nr:nucleotidyltransferase family protein [Candidatus Woesearchaeota archaeon]